HRRQAAAAALAGDASHLVDREPGIGARGTPVPRGDPGRRRAPGVPLAAAPAHRRALERAGLADEGAAPLRRGRHGDPEGALHRVADAAPLAVADNLVERAKLVTIAAGPPERRRRARVALREAATA